MRKIVFDITMSLDGFIKAKNGEMNWVITEQKAAYANTFLSRFDTIFYGRVAYEKFGVPQPVLPTQSQTEREFNTIVSNMRKYVFSRSVNHVAGNGMVVRANMESEVNRIRDENGKDIWFFGGASILRAFIDLDLIDEYQLAVQSKTLSAEKPLFNPGKRLNLKLIKTQHLKSGVVLLHYRPESRIKKNLRYDRSF